MIKLRGAFDSEKGGNDSAETRENTAIKWRYLAINS